MLKCFRAALLSSASLSVVYSYPDAAEAARWVKIHNTYRCMHGVGNVGWNDDVAKVAYDYGMTLSGLVHSKSYSLPPPAGPAGENLAMGYPALEQAVSGWYAEVNDCERLPGCDTGKGGAMVGHFTAMIWKGVTEIGCGVNPNNMIYTCHYKSGTGPEVGPWTANMAGGYEQSVPAATGKTYETCEAEVAAAALHPAVPDVKAMYPNAAAAPGGRMAQAFGGGQINNAPGFSLFNILMCVVLFCGCYGVYTCFARKMFGKENTKRLFPEQFHIESTFEKYGNQAQQRLYA